MLNYINENYDVSSKIVTLSLKDCASLDEEDVKNEKSQSNLFILIIKLDKIF